MKKCYINSQTGVTQLNRSGKNAPNREKCKKHTHTYTKLQVVNYGWNLEGEGSGEGWKTKPSPDHKEPRNHDQDLNFILEAVGSHRGILTIIFTFRRFTLVAGNSWRKEGDCRQGQCEAAASQAGDTGDLSKDSQVQGMREFQI